MKNETSELIKSIKDQPFKVAFKATLGVAAAQLTLLAVIAIGAVVIFTIAALLLS